MHLLARQVIPSHHLRASRLYLVLISSGVASSPTSMRVLASSSDSFIAGLRR